MTDRERLIELLHSGVRCPGTVASCGDCPHHSFHTPCDEFGATADMLIANGVTIATDNNVGSKWIPASEPPKEYRDEYNELKCFLVCTDGTELPFRAMYDGKNWGDGIFVVPVKWWMPLPEPPKENRK